MQEMKINSTHKNLNTSYVNLSALLKFLRGQNFIGRVHFEAKGYEAEIFFTKENKLNARENDHLAGRISVGDEVLSHILIRAHEPGGVINVFDETEEEIPAQIILADTNIEVPADEIEEDDEKAGTAGEDSNADTGILQEIAKPVSLKEKLGLPSLPFSFRKKRAKTEIAEMPKEEIIEEIIQEPEIEEDPLHDWHELLELIGEILDSVEKSLAEANLNFIWVFDKVRAEVYEEYPFLHPNSPVFEYKNGNVSMTEQINNNLFVASIVESLRLLLGKLETHPKFAEVHRSTIRNILELMNKRHAQYDKYLISQQLEKLFE